MKRGSYRYRVIDKVSGRQIFQQGYATLFDEWEGTPEAQAGVRRTMSESVRFPMPKNAAILRIDRRLKDGTFREMYELGIDPSSYLISRAKPFRELEVVELWGGQPPESALDILIVPEGYATDDKAKLLADFKRFAEALIQDAYWRTQLERIHLRGILAYSRESGVTEPRKSIFRDTVLGASFNTFDSPRYLTVVHTKALRQIASRAPYDNLFVMVNSARYGGGGVYNQWSVYTSDNEYDDYVMLHEFGHHMAGLADEYYTSAIANDEDLMYPPGTEPWEPNITAFLGKDLRKVKWRDLIASSTPIPTTEGKVPLGTVGLFEGAGYKAKGLYRPQEDCKMFHKGLVGFCQVCTRAITDMVSYYSGAEIQR